MSARSPRRPFVAALAGIAVALSGLAVVSTATPAQAVSPDLVISQVYGGGGNSGAPFTHDFIELYNRGASPVALEGKSLQYTSATGTGNFGSSATTLTELSGTLAPGAHLLVQEASQAAVGSPLPTPDVTDASPIAMSGTAGKVALVTGIDTLGCNGGSTTCTAPQLARIIDLVGYGTANFFEGAAAAPALSNTTAALRSANGATDTDNNAADFASGPPNPRNSAPVVTDLAATDPADVDAIVDTPIEPINLEATGGTPDYSWDVSGLPSGLSETSDGVIEGMPTAIGSSLVTATVTDSATPTPDTDSVQFSISVTEPTEAPIAEIQGTDTDTSPFNGQVVSTEGVITALYPGGTGLFNGIYIQTAGSGGSTNTTPGASDAIFVFGGNSQSAGVEIGDSVEVTGEVSEFFGTTEITPGPGGVVEVASLGSVTPRATVPGTDCALPGTACLTGAALNSAREAFEGEVFQPTGDYTVTDVNDGSPFNGGSFSSSFFGEIGLAAESDLPLITPTELIDAQATADIAARKAYNDAHRMILDDGAGVTYWNTSNTGQMSQPFPWFTVDNQVRVGAAVTFPKPVVMEWRNNIWKLQPQTRVTDDGDDRVAFEQDRPAAPEEVGGDLKLATFNVLNYFTTLGEDFAGCTAFNDRAGNPIAVNSCPGNGPRGAWNDVSFGRQQAKIVNAINTIDADIVSVEEIENSLKVDGHDRDEALAALVTALNADAGAGTWDYVHSPASASDPGNIDEQDVIRTGFIYKPATVETIGAADMLFDSAAFGNAREPFAQAFKAAGGDDADGFAVIVNHFKSKGSGVDDGTGQGAANPDRIAQAEALSVFADAFAAARGVGAVFLTGDFNSNSMEDPMQVLYGDGYIGQKAVNKWSYNFDGQAQSLDHVLGNPTADAMVTGVDIWQVNANETVFNQYSRYNYNATILYNEAPYSASDHNPEVIGIDVPDPKPAATIEVKVTPKKVKVHKTRAMLHIDVVGAEGAATGTVVVRVAGQPDQAVALEDGRANVRLEEFHSTGAKTVTVEYGGDSTTGAATRLVTIQVQG